MIAYHCEGDGALGIICVVVERRGQIFLGTDELRENWNAELELRNSESRKEENRYFFLGPAKEYSMPIAYIRQMIRQAGPDVDPCYFFVEPFKKDANSFNLAQRRVFAEMLPQQP